VHSGVGCHGGVVNTIRICRFLEGVLLVLDGGKERVNRVMCLCARFGDELARCESVIELSVCRKSGWEETFKKFGQGVIEIHSPVGGSVSPAFVIAFVDGLHEEDLPICRLHLGFPYGIGE